MTPLALIITRASHVEVPDSDLPESALAVAITVRFLTAVVSAVGCITRADWNRSW
jgi:hypothetical protein